MTKLLNGKELAGFVKERQAREVKNLRAKKVFPKLVIVRDSDNPVITKYVNLKKRYGEDISVSVEDLKVDAVEDKSSLTAAQKIIKNLNADKSVSGIIVQLPLKDKNFTDDLVNLIAPEKDVDGLNQVTKTHVFESATATAITWLLAGHDIDLKDKKVALVGYGRLVGRPLERIFKGSGVNYKIFRHDSNLAELKNFDVIISATGVPHLIKNAMVRPGAILIDAGTASEDGVLVGDVDESVRARKDLTAITPKIGGVGPLTVTVLLDNVIHATKN